MDLRINDTSKIGILCFREHQPFMVFAKNNTFILKNLKILRPKVMKSLRI
jgi:hypothetical protein